MADHEPESGDGRRFTRRFPIYVAVLAAIAIGIAAALHERSSKPLTLRAGTALPDPRPIADFRLVDEHESPFDRSDLEGRWSVLFTGFTHCPDVCPTTIALMAEMRRRISRDDLQFVFVSVDPERDSPEVVAAYLAHFDPTLVGATGSRPEMERFTAALGLAQVRNPGVGDEYTVDHSTALVLIDPRARIAGYFQAPHQGDALATDLAKLPRS